MEGPGDAGSGELSLVLGPAVHEAGHLNLGNVELLATEIGEGDVGDLVISLRVGGKEGGGRVEEGVWG